MPHHYTKNVTEAQEYCRTCNAWTMHYVSDGRLGRCKNEHAVVDPTRQPMVSLSGKQVAELNGMKTEDWSDDTRHEMPLKQFLTVVDFLGENAPVWAVEIAFARDGAKT